MSLIGAFSLLTHLLTLLQSAVRQWRLLFLALASRDCVTIEWEKYRTILATPERNRRVSNEDKYALAYRYDTQHLGNHRDRHGPEDLV